MEIAGVETELYELPPHREIEDAIQSFEHMELVVVRLQTDEGREGTGFTYTIGRGGRAVKTLLDSEVTPLVVGQSALDQERIWAHLWEKLHWVGRQGIFSLAVSAVDIAGWDLKARVAGMPLYELLGGYRDRMPMYNTDGGWLNHPTETLVEESVQQIDAGFHGVKLKVGKPSGREDVRRISAVREAIGDEPKLMVDANMVWTAEEAIRRARMFEDFDLFWFEEPIEADDVGGHRALARKTSLPVAVGESLYNAQHFTEYVRREAASILQPDVGRVGGVTSWLKVAHTADTHNMKVCPHFLMELHVHLACAVPNALFVEYIPFLNPYLTQPLSVEDGYCTPPERPGHGVRFDWDGIEQYRVR